MQHPLVGVVTGGGEDAGAVAWTAVADGYERALATPGLSEDDRGCFIRQLRRARQLAGDAPLVLAPVRRVARRASGA